MTRLRPLMGGVCLAALATSAFAQTAPASSTQAEEIALLRQQVAALSSRLEQLEAQSRDAAPAVVQATSAASTPTPAIQTLSSAPVAPTSTLDWSSGLPEWRSPDGGYSFRPRLRVQSDLSATTGSRFANRDLTGTELRSLRLGFQGKLAGGWAYWMEGDLSDNSISVNNAFLSYSRKIGRRDLEVSFGQRLNDRGVEGATPEDQTPFLERSFTTATLGPERGAFGMGVMAKLVGSAWHASVSVTGDDVSNGTGDDSVSIMLRTHWSPLKTDRGMLHLGGWGFIEDISSYTPSITRNELVASRFNDNLRLSTGLYNGARSTTGFGLEAGAIQGPAWLMVEGGRRTVDATAGTFDQDVANVSLGVFLTGEVPPLSSRTGTWARPKVLRPVGSGGYGALELVARYDAADFSDNPTGGEGDVWAAGVNWYPSINTRVSVHLSHWSITNRTGAFLGEDSGDTITARVQAAF